MCQPIRSMDGYIGFRIAPKSNNTWSGTIAGTFQTSFIKFCSVVSKKKFKTWKMCDTRHTTHDTRRTNVDHGKVHFSLRLKKKRIGNQSFYIL